MFSLICAWTNGWVNNQDADDLRRHRTHYDVAVMRRCDNENDVIDCLDIRMGLLIDVTIKPPRQRKWILKVSTQFLCSIIVMKSMRDTISCISKHLKSIGFENNAHIDIFRDLLS